MIERTKTSERQSAEAITQAMRPYRKMTAAVYMGEACQKCWRHIKANGTVESCFFHTSDCPAFDGTGRCLDFTDTFENVECLPCDEGPVRFEPLDIEYRLTRSGILIDVAVILVVGDPSVALLVDGSDAVLRGSVSSDGWCDSIDVKMPWDANELHDHYDQLWQYERGVTA